MLQDASTAARIRVYFLGSGRIGLPVLDAILRAPEIEVVGAGTQPDRPSGRHRRLHHTSVGDFLVARGIVPDQPGSVNTSEFLSHIRALRPDVILVVCFGQLLKRGLLELAPFGCVNVHTSLLPLFRGASPIAGAILAGAEQTGVTFMQMDEGLDTGPVYQRFGLPLAGTETNPVLEGRLAQLAGDHIGDCLVAVCRGRLGATPQDDGAATHAGKIRKRDGNIDWRLPAMTIERMIRAYTPWPRALFELPTAKGRRRLQLVSATVLPQAEAEVHRPGDILQADDHGWVVTCGTDSLRIDRLIPEGRVEMTGGDFLRGARLTAGMNIGRQQEQGMT